MESMTSFCGDFTRLTTVRDIVDLNRKLVTVAFGEDIRSVLKKLGDNGIHSALVINPDKPWEIFGFVDVLDILYHVLDCHSQTGDYRTMQWESMCFGRVPAWTVSNISKSNSTLSMVEPSATLAEVIDLFSKGIHRAPVVIPPHTVATVISQSDVIGLLSRRGVGITGPIVLRDLKELGLDSSGVVVVDEDLPLTDVLMKMKEHNVSGVPVVDKEGKILSNFSASDLKDLQESNWSWITLGVRDFFKKHRGMIRPPVCLTAKNTLEDLLLKYTTDKVSRVYLVNHRNEPEGVITHTDVIQFFQKISKVDK